MKKRAPAEVETCRKLEKKLRRLAKRLFKECAGCGNGWYYGVAAGVELAADEIEGWRER